jgi:glycosyltransferase involved in cell wall biosynthesis
VHLYLTVPFVLSWSLLEAMAAGCCIVSSCTPPVEEVLVDGENALLVDFFDPAAQAAAIGCLLDDPQRRQRLGAAAQAAAEAYDASIGLASWRALLSVDAD